MKEIEFEHFRKAPHPFEQYGNLPPIALRNRSLGQEYGSLPQGEEAFVNKIGKRMFDESHKSSIKQHWLGIENNDSLSEEISRYHHKVKGKSLETKDIEGAQGGSLKSSAVKYKEKALELKNQGKINGFDRYNFEKEEYRYSIENAIKSQHENDRSIGKMISEKGHGHYLNPENQPRLKNDSKMKNSLNNQQYLSQKYSNFENKNEKYQEFFTNAKNDEETYEKFFSNYQNSPNSYGSIETPKIREKKQSSYENYSTISQENYKEQNEKELRKEYEIWRQKQMLKNYQPPNFSKKSIESQFRNEQGKGINLSPFKNENNLNTLSFNESLSNESYLSESKIPENISPKITRKMNPTNISNPLGSKEIIRL